jgi:hypothetical protein
MNINVHQLKEWLLQNEILTKGDLYRLVIHGY